MRQPKNYLKAFLADLPAGRQAVGRPSPSSSSVACRFVVLWRIEGYEVGDSSAGPSVVYALTDDGTIIPDPQTAIRAASNGRYVFHQVDEIRLVGMIEVPIEDDADRLDDSAHPCVNLTASTMDDQTCDALGRLIAGQAYIADRLLERAHRISALRGTT